ncbi:MAG: L-threonylcarbamoyladenylate synthase [Salaquimonas sp.]
MTQTVSTKQSANALSEAVSVLRAGLPVAIPTETVYGLAADATNGAAVARIFSMKGRPSFNPLICHVDGQVMAEEYGLMNRLASRLAAKFWPGPLTIVVPLHSQSLLHDLVTAGLGTVGLRCPKGFSRQIISAFGRPLAAPSANKSGRISTTTAEHVAAEYGAEELLIIDDGPCPVGLESTIVKIDGDHVTLLRSGAVGVAEIEAISGTPIRHPSKKSGILAPGMMVSHYAPNASVKLNCSSCPDHAGWLGFGNQPAPKQAAASLNLSPSSNLVEAAANLYAFMKQLDAKGVRQICVAPIPMEELGIAINDRLSRAAAPRGNISEVTLR